MREIRTGICHSFDTEPYLSGVKGPTSTSSAATTIAPGDALPTLVGLAGSARVTARPHVPEPGQLFFNWMRVDVAPASGLPALEMNNMNLHFAFEPAASMIFIGFHDEGGAENLVANGGTPDALELEPAVVDIGGAVADVWKSPNGHGELIIHPGEVRRIRELEIGGQEFWIERICWS